MSHVLPTLVLFPSLEFLLFPPIALPASILITSSACFCVHNKNKNNNCNKNNNNRTFLQLIFIGPRTDHCLALLVLKPVFQCVRQ